MQRPYDEWNDVFLVNQGVDPYLNAFAFEEENQAARSDEAQVEEKWPHHVKRGIEMIQGVEAQDEWIEAFAAQWGGLTQEAIERAFFEGKGDERVTALCMLGFSPYAQATAHLLPLLQSSNPKERWLSAVCLGERGESQAHPMLETMLTEFLPSAKAPVPIAQQYWFDTKRMWVANLLFDANDPSIVPLFRRAFVVSIQAEYFVRNPISLDYGRRFQRHLMRLLGKRGAFGVLVGLEVSALHLQVATVNLALGFRYDDQRAFELIDRFPLDRKKSFGAEVAVVLTERFGLTEEEQDRFLDAHRLHP